MNATTKNSPQYSLVLQAVARGWCAPENASKVMDCDLAEAITREVIAIAPPALTFDAFREANVARCVKWHPQGIESWSPSDWLTAVTGELGELASLLKMRNRERDGLAGNKFSPTDKMIADEIADVQTYLDLLAAALGVNLGRATVEKFNEISERVGFPDRITVGNAAPVRATGGELREALVRIAMGEEPAQKIADDALAAARSAPAIAPAGVDDAMVERARSALALQGWRPIGDEAIRAALTAAAAAPQDGVCNSTLCAGRLKALQRGCALARKWANGIGVHNQANNVVLRIAEEFRVALSSQPGDYAAPQDGEAKAEKDCRACQLLSAACGYHERNPPSQARPGASEGYARCGCGAVGADGVCPADQPVGDDAMRMLEIVMGSREQCDECGTMIAVSRQALEELASMMTAQEAARG